ncbi:hypothetical protein [Burkholderia sp. LMG 21824]|uniref:hypothetical protein n=1 Tax=Burkholderia sp. LMG 21824 TaxID=3158172 RepID=UPI003C2D4E44
MPLVSEKVSAATETLRKIVLGIFAAPLGRVDGTWPKKQRSESVQKYLREALRIIRAATDISGDVPKALYWYRNEPLPIFDYTTAEQLVSEGRADDLLRYVVALDAGVAG